ncbi:MAG: hypothetical protein HQL03_10700 [Nitrospirae bacterium]|nr:hypothetical protein [Nitrospirota bacterium]MBF0593247.1 hypothetical protein [Nitrospirota bacterium]
MEKSEYDFRRSIKSRAHFCESLVDELMSILMQLLHENGVLIESLIYPLKENISRAIASEKLILKKSIACVSSIMLRKKLESDGRADDLHVSTCNDVVKGVISIVLREAKRLDAVKKDKIDFLTEAVYSSMEEMEPITIEFQKKCEQAVLENAEIAVINRMRSDLLGRMVVQESGIEKYLVPIENVEENIRIIRKFTPNRIPRPLMAALLADIRNRSLFGPDLDYFEGEFDKIKQREKYLWDKETGLIDYDLLCNDYAPRMLGRRFMEKLSKKLNDKNKHNLKNRLQDEIYTYISRYEAKISEGGNKTKAEVAKLLEGVRDIGGASGDKYYDFIIEIIATYPLHAPPPPEPPESTHTR